MNNTTTALEAVIDAYRQRFYVEGRGLVGPIDEEIKEAVEALEQSRQAQSSAPAAASEREALTDEREAFEAWLVAHDGMVERLPDGDYESWFAGHAWEGWQARAALNSTGKPDGEVAPLHLGACLTDGKLHATVMRRESNGHITVVATAEIDEASLRSHDVHAEMHDAAPADAPVAEPVVEIDCAELRQKLDYVKKNASLPFETEQQLDHVRSTIAYRDKLYSRPPAPEDAKDAAEPVAHGVEGLPEFVYFWRYPWQLKHGGPFEWPISAAAKKNGEEHGSELVVCRIIPITVLSQEGVA